MAVTDGGALFTNDFKIAEIARSCRIHGQGTNKYQTVRLGMTARLDTIQGAILLAKLEVFDKELQQRNAVANYYHELLKLGSKPIVPIPWLGYLYDKVTK